MKKADLVRFRHMLDAAKEAVEISSGKSRQDIENERLLNLSLVRLLEIMGEAANFISSDLQTKYSKIEWSQIIGMRNRLIHGYDNIDYDILYQTIKKDIPPLIVELEHVVKSGK